MFSFLKRWRERRILARHPIAEADWREVLAHSGAIRRLPVSDQARLRVLATFLLQEKSLEPVQGLSLTGAMRAMLAAIEPGAHLVSRLAFHGDLPGHLRAGTGAGGRGGGGAQDPHTACGRSL